MKKVMNILLCIILVITMVSCNRVQDKTTTKTSKTKSIEGRDASISNIKIHLGQAFTASIKGDLNKEGTYSYDGSYFLYNLKVENVNDYEYIVIDTKIQNDNNKSVKIFKAGWQATLTDGTKLPDIKINEMGEWEEITSGSKLDISILVPVEKKLKISEINLKYDDKNYATLNSALVEGNDNKIDEKNGIGSVDFNNIEIIE